MEWIPNEAAVIAARLALSRIGTFSAIYTSNVSCASLRYRNFLLMEPFTAQCRKLFW